MGYGKAGLEVNGFAVVFDSLVGISQIAQHNTQVEVYFGDVGLNRQGFAIARGSFCVLALPFLRNAQYVMQHQRVWVNMDEIPGAGFCLSELIGVQKIE